jgi:hypothetical protein
MLLFHMGTCPFWLSWGYPSGTLKLRLDISSQLIAHSAAVP